MRRRSKPLFSVQKSLPALGRGRVESATAKAENITGRRKKESIKDKKETREDEEERRRRERN